MAYEKFFIVEEKTGYLAAFHMTMLSLLYITLWYMSAYSPLIILIAMIAIRLVAFIILGSISFFVWQIIPTWHIQPRYLAVSLGISIGFFLL